MYNHIAEFYLDKMTDPTTTHDEFMHATRMHRSYWIWSQVAYRHWHLGCSS